MNYSNLIKTKIAIILLCITGIAGTVLFFPVQLDGRYTCLFHRMLHSQYPVGDHQNRVLEQEKKTVEKEAGDQRGHNHNDALLERYIRRYAGFWWGSIALTGIGYLVWKKGRRQDIKKDLV